MRKLRTGIRPKIIKRTVAPLIPHREVKPVVVEEETTMDSFEAEYQKFIAELKAKKERNEAVIQEKDSTNLQPDGQVSG